MPFEVRRAQLGSFVDSVDGITFSQEYEDDAALVFGHACEPELEGIVSKCLVGVYSSGRSRNWLKVRNLAPNGGERGTSRIVPRKK